MPLMEFQLRIRNAADSANALVVTSVAGGTNPYIAGPPSGSGESFDPRTGETEFAEYSGEIVDADIGSMQRLVTSLIEDADGRAQLGYRIAVLEYRLDGGSWLTLINGLLTRLEKTAAAKWAYAVGDPLHALPVTQLFSPSSETNVTDFLAEWPARGCILGGPIIGGNDDASGIGIADRGGWTMRVATGLPGLGTNEYALIPLIVYGAPTWEPTGTLRPSLFNPPHVAELADAINDAAATVQQAAGNSAAAAPWDTIREVYENGYIWQGLVVLIDSIPWKPLPVYDDEVPLLQQRNKLVRASGSYAMRVKSDGVRTLTDGQIVRVRALTALPTEASPLYLSGHPCDLLKRCLAAANIACDSTAFDDFKDIVGQDAAMTLRITSGAQAARLVAEICKRDGIGLRGNDDGEIEPFDARLGRSITDPSVTITDADVVLGSVKPYRLDVSRAIKNMIFRSKHYADQRSVPVGRDNATLVEGVVVSDIEIPLVNADTAAIPHGDFTLSIEAMVHASRAIAGRVTGFAQSIARRLFDRYGRGAITAEAILIRGGAGDGARLGDELFVNVTQMVNHNYMLGDNPLIAARAMQIVERTWKPTGYAVRLEDSGASRQPPSTVPTLSIAASSDLPRTVAEATITDAATLNAAGNGARLQWAFTTDGSDADTAQFTDIAAWGPGEIPTGAVRLPPIAAGVTVQVRARSELPQARATNWSSLAKVTLTGVDAPTGLVATPDAGDGSRCLFEWTPANDTDLVDVFLRLDGADPHDLPHIATLEPGSIQYELTGLDVGEDYIATVQHRDPLTHDGSSRPDVSFTTSGATLSLNPPIDPAPFASRPDGGRLARGASLLDGIYGIGVVATVVPGWVEIAQAIEDAPGAGTYGSFQTVGRVDAVSGNWTLWQAVAPNDGLRRKLKARHIDRNFAFTSVYTDEVIATPWTYQALPAYPGDALLELKVTPLTPTAPDRFAFRLTPRDPLPTGAADLDLDFDVETGLVLYEYGTTTPAAAVSATSGDNLDYEAIRADAGDGTKSTSWRVTKTGRRVGLSGPIVVPEQPYAVSGVPSIDNASASSASTPCDGGGGFTLSLSTSNMPTGAVFDLVWTNIGGGTYDGVSSPVSGVSNGAVIGDGGLSPTVPLCPGDSLRLTITAFVDGVQIAAGSFEGPV